MLGCTWLQMRADCAAVPIDRSSPALRNSDAGLRHGPTLFPNFCALLLPPCCSRPGLRSAGTREAQVPASEVCRKEG